MFADETLVEFLGVQEQLLAELLHALRFHLRALAYLREEPINRIAGHAKAGLGPVTLPGSAYGLPRTHGRGQHQQDHKHACNTQKRAVLAGKLAQPVAKRRRTGEHRLVVQVALYIHGKAIGGLVAAVSILF